MISTRHLSKLPDVDTLRRVMQSLAMLDAILSSSWESRYFSFNSRWKPAEQMGSMRNGQGDHYFALFNSAGCWLKGFDHESPLAGDGSEPPAGIFDNMPPAFAGCLLEPAFALDETTFCIWRTDLDKRWRHGPVALDGQSDGSERLLWHLDGVPETYCKWANEYYECGLTIKPVRAIFAQKPLNKELVAAMNDKIHMSDLRADLKEIGYPLK